MEEGSCPALLMAAAGSLAFLAAPAQGITNGQIETFSGGLGNWWGYSSYEVLQHGGPSGTGDSYLHNYSTSPSGWLSMVNNSQQWRGDYATAGVTHIEADLINLGTSDLYVRSYLSGDGREGGDFVSTFPLLLPADGQWHHAVFGLSAAELTHEPSVGGNDLNTTLHGVTRLSLRHEVDLGQGLGTQILGSWGLDNIRALPEPTTWVSLLLLGVVVLSRKT